jgi:GTP-binding protein required for 40S ribosome biogenesis
MPCSTSAKLLIWCGRAQRARLQLTVPKAMAALMLHCSARIHLIVQVLLMVDGSYGFEMETFEFLNILQAHGFPKVMGVLTHLDRLPTVKQVRRAKKELKQRFWTEIYQVSGMARRERGRELACHCAKHVGTRLIDTSCHRGPSCSTSAAYRKACTRRPR